jgi:hypothetical protein
MAGQSAVVCFINATFAPAQVRHYGSGPLMQPMKDRRK